MNCRLLLLRDLLHPCSTWENLGVDDEGINTCRLRYVRCLTTSSHSHQFFLSSPLNHRLYNNIRHLSMKLQLAPVLVALTLACATPQYEQHDGASLPNWAPPGPNDGMVSILVIKSSHMLMSNSSRPLPYAEHACKPWVHTTWWQKHYKGSWSLRPDHCAQFQWNICCWGLVCWSRCQSWSECYIFHPVSHFWLSWMRKLDSYQMLIFIPAANKSATITSWNTTQASGKYIFQPPVLSNVYWALLFSRLDAEFGSNIAFNQEIFDQTKQYWTSPTLDPVMLANSKLRRQIESRAFNPNYTFTAKAETFSLGEIASFVVVFGDVVAGTANRSLVEFLFGS